jgi:hypothetical protein
MSGRDITILALATALGLAAGMAKAQEFVTAKGQLSDEDFYRLVACAAPPGGTCQKDFVRWSKRDAKDISIRIVQVDDGYPRSLEAKVTAKLDQAIAELNAAGANLHVSRTKAKTTPDIRIFLLDIPKDGAISGTGLPWFDGNDIGVARMQMGWRENGTVIECAVAISRGVKPGEVQRILIEEITQCMGLMTDIGGAYYESRSIFSETSGAANRLGQQDIMALRRHYP